MLKTKISRKFVETEELEEVICNFCGKPFDKGVGQGYLLKTGGGQVISFDYGSRHDGEVVRFDICDDCFEKHILGNMVISPVISLIGDEDYE